MIPVNLCVYFIITRFGIVWWWCDQYGMVQQRIDSKDGKTILIVKDLVYFLLSRERKRLAYKLQSLLTSVAIWNLPRGRTIQSCMLSTYFSLPLPCLILRYANTTHVRLVTVATWSLCRSLTSLILFHAVLCHLASPSSFATRNTVRNTQIVPLQMSDYTNPSLTL